MTIIKADRMCNLYTITTNQAAIIALFRAVNHNVGNPPPMPGVFSGVSTPVVRNRDELKKFFDIIIERLKQLYVVA